jgi:hypothetical protein
MALQDITNVLPTKHKVVKKRLSDGTQKLYTYNASRKHIELIFNDESEKLKFESKLEDVKRNFGCKSVKDTLVVLLEKCGTQDTGRQYSHQTGVIPPMPSSFNSPLVGSPTDGVCRSSNLAQNTSPDRGQNTSPDMGQNTSPPHGLFICEHAQVWQLVRDITVHNTYCGHALHLAETSQNGHVAQVVLQCNAGHHVRWASSSTLGNNFSVNYKLILAYICSGISPIEYQRIATFADIGQPTLYFRNKTITTLSEIVNILTDESMQGAVFDEKQAAKDRSSNGISIMTDARHGCRKNSHHTDHVALGQVTHRVLDYQHVTRTDDNCSQRHETIGCSRMYTKFEERGVTIENHIHDRNMAVNKMIKARGNTRNSNERWHAAKSITNHAKKIAKGTKATIGKTWHPQLADKGSLIRNHAYWAMDHCNNNAAELRSLIDTSLSHFQDQHDLCDQFSTCRTEGYVPTFTIVRDPAALDILKKFLHSMVLYKNAEDYVLACDTYYVESFNNACLIYQDKRIHYGDQVYKLRIQLAVLDWNEHVDRPYTSRHTSIRPDHPRRHLGKKVYKKKTYKFVQDIWEMLKAVLQITNDADDGEQHAAQVHDIEYADSDDTEDDMGDDQAYHDVEDPLDIYAANVDDEDDHTYVQEDGYVYLVLD